MTHPKFAAELQAFSQALGKAKTVLITAPGSADGDSIGAQLAVQEMLRHRYPQLRIVILNDEELPERYRFLPKADKVETPESFGLTDKTPGMDIGIVVDGGIDRAGRVKALFDRCGTRVFIDHHAISADYAYDIRIVEAQASSTTQLVYELSQTAFFQTPVDVIFAQSIYLGLIFDTGFFRHSNTTPEVMELGARLLRTGFDFTRVGERGMLERSFSSLKLMASTLAQAKLDHQGKIVYSILTQKMLNDFGATADDREGIIDHLFLTRGIEVAILFFELPEKNTKISLRSQGTVDVAKFARSLTERGGGHAKAAGANLAMSVQEAEPFVLERLKGVVG